MTSIQILAKNRFDEARKAWSNAKNNGGGTFVICSIFLFKKKVSITIDISPKKNG